MADEALHGALHVEHLEVEAVADDAPWSAAWPPDSGVERGLGEDDLRDLRPPTAFDRHAVDEDAEHLRLGLERVVAGEHGLAHARGSSE